MKLQRLGLIMQPESGNLMEVEGVLNPAAIRCPDGNLYLFPRLVGKKKTTLALALLKLSLMMMVTLLMQKEWVLL